MGASFRKLGLALTLGAGLVAAGLGAADPASAKSPVSPADLPSVSLSALPPEAQSTKALILAGGPFPYGKDGSVFMNRERLLPGQSRGYYREYTVRTPGSPDRGARRIVCGGAQPVRPDACYYTADHYASFRLITP